MSPAELERARAERSESESTGDEYGVAPDNWLAYCTFTALTTQWRIVAGFDGAHYEGIEYGSFKTVCWAHGVKKRDRRRLFEDIRIMEDEARAVLNQHD